MSSFVEWPGGNIPVDPSTRVTVKFRDGRIQSRMNAGFWDWNHRSPEVPGDIVGYDVGNVDRIDIPAVIRRT